MRRNTGQWEKSGSTGVAYGEEQLDVGGVSAGGGTTVGLDGVRVPVEPLHRKKSR